MSPFFVGGLMIVFMIIMCAVMLAGIIIGLWACLIAAKRADELTLMEERRKEDEWQKHS